MLRMLIPAAIVAAVAPAAQAGEVWASIDTVTRYQMSEGVGQVIVTNPAVADIEVASATELMLFGRMPGFTDVIFHDADGKRLGQVRVRVRNERAGVVTLYNGAERFSFSCTDRCEQTPMIGDGRIGAMAQVLQQSQLKLGAGEQAGGLSTESVSVERAQQPAPGPLPDPAAQRPGS